MDNKSEKNFSQLVSKCRQSKGLVGLGAIVLQNGVVQGISVSGERAVKTGVLIAINDKWHIGSITKSITATLLACLIERKKLSWNTSVEQVFGSSELLHDDWKRVTIIDLMTHTSGAVPNFPIWVNLKHPKEGADRISARKKVVLNVLKKPPLYLPKSKHLYSNVGYTILGVIAEELTGESWEALIQAEVFGPLGLVNSGFGPPKDITGFLEQPRGHRRRYLGNRKARVGTDADNSPVIGPAGTIHMSLTDLANFGNEHLYGDRGEGRLLSDDSYKSLHAPYLENYACGWVVNEDKLVWHNGSNTMWYAFLAYEPSSNRVIAITANDPDIESCEYVATKILEESKTLFE